MKSEYPSLLEVYVGGKNAESNWILEEVHKGEKLSERELRDMYQKEKLNAKQIAERHGVSKATIFRWMVEYGIERRDFGEAIRLVRGTPNPSREEIASLYSEGMSISEIGKYYDVSQATVFNWMSKLSLKRRTVKEAQILASGNKRPSAEELNYLYYEKGMILKEISSRYGVGITTIRTWMDQEKIERRNKSEAVKSLRQINVPSTDELRKVCLDDKLTNEEMAKKYGVGVSTIKGWVHDANIQRASKRKLPNGVDKLSKEELVQLYHENGLSIRKIARQYSIDEEIVSRWMDEFGLTRKTRIENGLWRNLEYTLNQARRFLDENPEYQELPPGHILEKEGYSSLVNAINRYHGGIPLFRKIVNEDLGISSGEEKKSLLEQYVGGKE